MEGTYTTNLKLAYAELYEIIDDWVPKYDMDPVTGVRSAPKEKALILLRYLMLEAETGRSSVLEHGHDTSRGT